MTQEQKRIILNQVETIYKPQVWQLYGLDIWPLIRKHVLFFSYDKVRTTKHSLARLLRVDLILLQLLNTIKFLFGKSTAKYLVVSSDSKRKRGQENSFVTYLTDQLNIGINDIELLEYNKSKDLCIPKTRYSTFHCQYFFEIAARLFSRGIVGGQQLHNFQEVKKEVDTKSDSLGEVFDRKNISKLAKKMKGYSNLFSKAIKKRSNLRAVLMEEYYTEYNMALVHAARQEGTPVIEFQHGVQNALHLTYGSFEEVPKNGFNTLPNLFWVWTSYEQKLLNKWMKGNTNHRAYVGGFTTVGKAAQSGKEESMRPSVLFTLQPIEEPISRALAATIKETYKDVDWLFRFHPNQLQNVPQIEALLRAFHLTDKVEYKEASSKGLGTVMATVDLHITMSSSCIIEAAAIGVPSIIVGKKGYEYYSDRLAELDAHYILDVQPSDIRNLMGRKSSKPLFIGSLDEALQLQSI